ncbi:MAG: hypothetical protein PVI92_08850 [Chromatiales bacterium]|jgi:hypothetical protein
MYFKSKLTYIASATLISTSQLAHAQEREFVTYEIDASASLVSDVRTRGISDSLLEPGLRLEMEIAHQSGLVGIAELVNASKTQFPDGKGLGMTLGAGYRFGDPDAWHFGVGVAAEIFPGAKISTAHNFLDAAVFDTNKEETKFDSNFLVLEVSYGALEGRILNVVSSTYRGVDTGTVCGAILYYKANSGLDPMSVAECYDRGDKDSRGTLLYDLDYTINLTPATILRLHAGYQDVANFPEADFADYGIGLTRKQWGFEWAIDYLTTRTKARELYLVYDDGEWHETDNNKLVLSIKRDF